MSFKHYAIPESTVENQETSTPKLLYTGVVCDDPKWFNIEHTHVVCEVLYVAGGCGGAIIAGIQYSLHEGDIIVINPLVCHQEWSDHEVPLYLLFFAFEGFHAPSLVRNTLLQPGMCPVIVSGDRKPQFDRYFLDLIHETETSLPFCLPIAESLLHVLVLLIYRLTNKETADDPDLSSECRRLKEFMDTNFMSAITLESLSSSIFVSKFHLAHAFKKEVGVSPIYYVIHKRINEAERLLSETDLPIKEISLQVGYPDSAYFSQMFKHITGKTPSAYRTSKV